MKKQKNMYKKAKISLSFNLNIEATTNHMLKYILYLGYYKLPVRAAGRV